MADKTGKSSRQKWGDRWQIAVIILLCVAVAVLEFVPVTYVQDEVRNGQRTPSCRQRRGHLADDPREERAVRQTREAALVFALSHHRGGQFPVLFLFYGQIAAVSYGGGGLGAVRAVLRGRGRL